MLISIFFQAGLSPLFQAAFVGHLEVVKVLVENSKELDTTEVLNSRYANLLYILPFLYKVGLVSSGSGSEEWS